MGFQKLTKEELKNHPRPKIKCGPGKTKTDMARETDINVIMAKYRKTGMVNFVNNRKPEYMAAPDIDFHEAMNAVVEAQNMFMDMPASLRKRFDNDPGQFLDFVHNPDNTEEMEKLGLLREPPQQPDQAPPAAAAAEPDS